MQSIEQKNTHKQNLAKLVELNKRESKKNIQIELSFFCDNLHTEMYNVDIATYEQLIDAKYYDLKYATIYKTDGVDGPHEMMGLLRIQGTVSSCLNSWRDIEVFHNKITDYIFIQNVTENPENVMYSKEEAEKLVRKATLSQMATEVNTFYKSKKHFSQFTVQGRQVIYLDYSIPTLKQKYGIAPIYVKANAKDWLKQEYKFLKEGRLL